MLFADDAALASHTENGLQQLVSQFSQGCKEFGFTISLKKTNVMAQGTDHPPTITIDGHVLEAVDDFTYPGSTISSSLTLETEISSRIAKAAAVMSKLHQRVWNNPSLTVKTKLRVYQACVLSTLLYSSEAWTPYARQERRLNSFYLRCLRRIHHIRWQDRVTDVEVLQQAGMTSMMSILRERRLRWLGHVHRMDPGRIPKDLLYGQLAVGTRPTRRPRHRYKDVCKREGEARWGPRIMALGCKKRSVCGRKRQKRNPRREESETKEEGVPTTTTINFHMCEVPEGLPFTGRATQPPPQMPLTQLHFNPELLYRLLKTEGHRQRHAHIVSSLFILPTYRAIFLNGEGDRSKPHWPIESWMFLALPVYLLHLLFLAVFRGLVQQRMRMPAPPGLNRPPIACVPNPALLSNMISNCLRQLMNNSINTFMGLFLKIYFIYIINIFSFFLRFI